jgi:large subunit ribosomal protein L21
MLSLSLPVADAALTLGLKRLIFQSCNPVFSRLASTMYAIFRSGDKQFRAEPGQTVRVPSLDADVGETVTFRDVLIAGTDDGTQVGAPTVSGALVTGEVVRHGKDKKVIIFKWKRRKNYRRKQGHRQKFTEVRIGEIRVG